MAGVIKRDYLRYQKEFLGMLMVYRERPEIKMFTEILLSLFTIILFAIFAIRPTLSTIAEIIQENKGKEETIGILSRKIDNLAIANDLLKKEQDNIALLESAIPNNPKPQSIATQITILGAQTSLSPEAMSFGSSTIKSERLDPPINATGAQKENRLPINSQPVNIFLDFGGEYVTLSTMFESLEKLRRPILIDTIVFSTENIQGRENEGPVIMSVSGQSPYFLESPEAVNTEDQNGQINTNNQ